MMRCLIALLLLSSMTLAGCSASSGEESNPTAHDRPSDGLAPDAGPAGGIGEAFGLTERFRPVQHFSPPFGWMNDPNGLIVRDGLYHLFFQYNATSTSFGDIGWGHAVSEDLARWRPLPVALSANVERQVFSGSVVAVEEGRPGPCDLVEPGRIDCLVAVYTAQRDGSDGPRQTQDIAISTDDGRNWQPYAGNPVIDRGLSDFRDPKVFWYEPAGRWIMVVALPLEQQIVLLGSPDLVSWEELSVFGPTGAIDGAWECPDLFPLPVEDEPGRTSWVMKVDLNPGHVAGGSGGQYFVGEFDGTTFRPAQGPTADEDDPIVPPAEPKWLDYGRDFYCATTFFDGQDELGRALWLGWMNNWEYAAELPTYPWRGAMTLPRRLSLVETPEGLRLSQQPVGIDQESESSGLSLSADSVPSANDQLDVPPSWLAAFDAMITVRPGAAERVGFTLHVTGDDTLAGAAAARVVYDVAQGGVQVDRPAAGQVGTAPEQFPGLSAIAPRTDADRPLRLHVVKDRSSLEVFVDDGQHVITSLLYPAADLGELEFFAEGGDVEGVELRVTPLDP